VIELGPVYKTGARATLRSIYVRDPDGNLVEIANERRSEEALWQQVSKLP
jgi:catechol-2,3-dioxygenase